MKKVRIGLIGPGELAQNFHLPILSKIPNVEITAICGRMRSKNENIAKRYNIEKTTTSVDDLVNFDDVDAVAICTPTELHFEMAMKAIEAGKPIMIEKPVTSTSKQAKEIADYSKEKNVPVMVGMNQRFREDAKQLKTHIFNNSIGDLLYIRSGWMQKKSMESIANQKARFGGVLTELGLSLIDSIIWLNESTKLISVDCNNFNRFSQDVEDMSVATMRFENGAVAVMECSWAVFAPTTNYYFNLYGKTGSISLNPLRVYKGNTDLVHHEEQSNTVSNLTIHRKAFESQIKHFIRSVAGYTPWVSTIEEAVHSLRTLEAMYQSNIEKQEIHL